ncbi:MAG: TPR end-of-group domain-containing protein [Ktedonobacterales bacterium]
MDPSELRARLVELLQQAWAEQQAMMDGLTGEQLAAVGTPAHWSAKEMVGHVVYWWRVQAERLNALAATGSHAPPLDDAEVQRRNAEVFAACGAQPWERMRADALETHDALMAALQRVPAVALLEVGRDGQWLWRTVLGNGYIHPQTHLALYARGGGDAAGWARILERASELLLQRLPLPAVQAIALYNIACIYAATGRPVEALARLRAALPLDPSVAEWSRHDTDLDPLRAQPEFQSLIFM